MELKTKRKIFTQTSNGEFIPCFGLTGPNNGSDATGNIDTGKVVIVNTKNILKLLLIKDILLLLLYLILLVLLLIYKIQIIYFLQVIPVLPLL